MRSRETGVVVFFLLSLFLSYGNCDSWVRLVHGVAGGPNVDIYIDNNLELSNIPYNAVSEYLPINNGNNIDFEIRTTGSETVLISDSIDLDNNEYYTVIVAGLLSNVNDYPLELLTFTDSDSQPSSGETRIRFIHASAGSPDVDFIINNTVIWADVNYKDNGNPEYESIDSGLSEAVQVNVAGSSTVVVGPVNLDFTEQSVYTIFALGIPNDVNYPLMATIAEDFQLFNNEDNSSSSTLFASPLILLLLSAIILYI